MQTRANTKAVNHWFLMLFIVLIFLYFIGYVLGLGTKKERSSLLSFFIATTLVRRISAHPRNSWVSLLLMILLFFDNLSEILPIYC